VPRLLHGMLHQQVRAAKHRSGGHPPAGAVVRGAGVRRLRAPASEVVRQGAGVADLEGLGEGGGGPSPFFANHSFLIASSTAWATISPPA
jgi:hypothetical protein